MDVDESTLRDEGEGAVLAAARRLGDERLAFVLAGLPDAVVAATADERIVFANDLAAELFGYEPDELLGRPIEELWPERVRERYVHNMRLYFATEHPLRFTDLAHGLRNDGSEFVGEMSWGIVTTAIGPVLFAIGRDVSAQRRRARQSAAVAALGERALAGAGVRELAEQAVDLMRGTLQLERVAVRGFAPPVVLAAWGAAPVPSVVSVPIRTTTEVIGTIELAPGLDDVDLAFVRATANILGMAAARLRDEERMRHEAFHDPLTGLANRTLLADRLGQALARSGRGGTTAVLAVDLDGFKHVNDTHGHAAGDAVLAAVAARLAAAVRPADTVARVGGDEFVVLCQDLDEAAARALAARLEAVVGAPHTVAGVEHVLGASIGIAHVAEVATTPERLLAAADEAAYRAKAQGGGRSAVAPPLA
jgi:diguanylate cyclase (GGDEF)-like protein/PAS domain S-box-containing protein